LKAISPGQAQRVLAPFQWWLPLFRGTTAEALFKRGGAKIGGG